MKGASERETDRTLTLSRLWSKIMPRDCSRLSAGYARLISEYLKSSENPLKKIAILTLFQLKNRRWFWLNCGKPDSSRLNCSEGNTQMFFGPLRRRDTVSHAENPQIIKNDFVLGVFLSMIRDDCKTESVAIFLDCDDFIHPFPYIRAGMGESCVDGRFCRAAPGRS